MAKVFGYMRVSQSSQTTENQKSEIIEAGYAVSEWFSEHGVSGSTPQSERKEWSRMMKMVEPGTVIVMTKMDRLGRDAPDILNTMKDMRRLKLKVIVLQLGQLDIASPAGKMVTTMLAAVAEMEMDLLKERIHFGLHRAKEQGVVMGAPTRIEPAVLKAICADKAAGLTLDQISKKHSVDRSTASRNILRWRDNLQGYENEFHSRVKHIAVKKAKMFGE